MVIQRQRKPDNDALYNRSHDPFHPCIAVMLFVCILPTLSISSTRHNTTHHLDADAYYAYVNVGMSLFLIHLIDTINMVDISIYLL